MADKTGIEWTDATWNPIRGCSRVSEGCKNCYAEDQAARIIRCDRGRGTPEGQGSYDGLLAPGGQWNGQIRLVPELLEQPLKWKRPRRIFVNSMSDLFHEKVPFEFIASVFAIMGVTTRHTYQILTKRPQRMLEFFQWALQDQDEDGTWLKVHPTDFCADSRIQDHWPEHISWDSSGYDNCGPLFPYENVHVGVSVEDQKTADERIPILLQVPAAVRWISAEPILERIKLNPAWIYQWQDLGASPLCFPVRLNWVVAGGESGPNARPAHPDWFRSLRDQCAAAGVPFLFKQHGEYRPDCEYYSDDDEARDAALDGSEVLYSPSMGFWNVGTAGTDEPHDGQPPTDTFIFHRVGKKKAGRLLDGVEHNGYPA